MTRVRVMSLVYVCVMSLMYSLRSSAHATTTSASLDPMSVVELRYVSDNLAFYPKRDLSKIKRDLLLTGH